MHFFSFVVVIIVVSSCSASSVWKVLDQHSSRQVGVGRNRVLASLEDKVVVEIDFNAFSRKVAKRSIGSRGSDGVVFAFPEGEKTCFLKESGVLNPELASKFPELKTRSGRCSDGSTLSINFLEDDETSISASFEEKKGDAYYVDKAEEGKSNQYFLYRKSKALRGVNPHNSFSCGHVAHEDSENEHVANKDSEEEHMENEDKQNAEREDKPNSAMPQRHGGLRDLQSEQQVVGIKLQLAVSTSYAYSLYHGGTARSVLNAITTLLNRVNGVYMRELGVFFQLFPDEEKLLCLTPDCPMPNDNANQAINANGDFIAARSSAKYDIGHSLTTGSGGLAFLDGFCKPDRKLRAGGTTGSSVPENDPFWVDYVAHELGHQLNGRHSFRDCRGQSDTSFDLQAAVEPGSGSSIMGYAGICPGNNLQGNSDPYFHSINLKQMWDVIELRSRFFTGCGERIPLANTERPKVILPINTCTVPVGNFVTLTGNASGPAEANWAFAWDRIDLGFETYSDPSVARFRSWKPTKSKSRDLPNMYYILFDGIGTQLNEVMPMSDQTMTFRFVGRTQYETQGTASGFDESIVGAFAYKDVQVSFSSAVPPLRLEEIGEKISPLSSFEVRWEVGGTAALSSSVVIEVAPNSMTRTNSFDFEDDLVELEWKSLGTFENSGQALVDLPDFPPGSKAVLKVRSSSSNCAFFDAKPFTVQGEAQVVTGSPTREQTSTPSLKPTPSPVPPLEGQNSALLYIVATSVAVASVLIFLALYRRRRIERSLSGHNKQSGGAESHFQIAIPIQ